MDESTRSNDGEPEITLLDLLATIIRHRTWVIWTTCVGTFVVATALFILPLLGVTVFGAPTVTLQAVVRAVTIPAEAQSLVNFDVIAIVQAQRSNLRLVGDVYRATLLTSREVALTKPAFNQVVRSFIDKSFRIVPDIPSATMLLSLRVSEQEQDQGTQFLKQFLSATKADLQAYAQGQTEQAISSLEMSGKASTELAVQSQVRYEVAAKTLRRVLADPGFPLSLVGGIEAMQEDSGIQRGPLLILGLLGSVFVGTLLAFAAEAVRKIRQDPTRVELLSKAWRRE